MNSLFGINNYLWKSVMQRRTGGCIEQFHIPRLWYQLCLRKTDNKNTFAPSFPKTNLCGSFHLISHHKYIYFLSGSLSLTLFTFQCNSLCIFPPHNSVRLSILFAQGKIFLLLILKPLFTPIFFCVLFVICLFIIIFQSVSLFKQACSILTHLYVNKFVTTDLRAVFFHLFRFFNLSACI